MSRDDQAPPSPPRDLSRREILFGLFFFPLTVLLLARHSKRWGRALLLVTLLAALCGGALAAVRLPGVYRESVAWAGWFGDTVGSLWMEDGRLYWETPSELPHSTRFSRWRVEFADEDDELDTGRERGPEQRGVWITHSQVLVWWLTSSGSVASLTLLDAGEGGPAMDLAAIWPDGLRVSGQEFPTLTRAKFFQALPIFFVFHWLEIWFPVVMYCLLFSVITRLLRGPLITGGLSSALCVTLYASIPPLVIATVYSAVGIPFLDFHRVFMVALFIYLLVVFSGVRRHLTS